MQLGFAKGRYKITPWEKNGCDTGVKSSLNSGGSPIIFLQRLKLATSNLVRGFSLPRAIINHTQRKSVRGYKLGNSLKFWGSPLIFLQRLKIATLKLAGWWGLPRVITKFYSERKRAETSARGAPSIWGFPLIFMQWLKVSTSNLVHSLGGQLGSS